MDGKMSIAIILEGNEEECLFDFALKNNGFHSNIEPLVINAGGYGNIGAYFQEFYSDPSYDCVIAIYDVDNKSNDNNSPYSFVRKELLSILGDASEVDLVSFCTNPNILQIILLGCDKLPNVSLSTSSKSVNSSIVHKYWPKIAFKKQKDKIIKSGYDASKWQLDIIKNSFIYSEQPHYNYDDLINNSLALSSDYKKNLPASNVPQLLKALKEGNVSFFDKIKKEKGE